MLFYIKRKTDNKYAKLDKTWYWATWVWDANEATSFNKKETANACLFNKLIGNKDEHEVVQLTVGVL